MQLVERHHKHISRSLIIVAAVALLFAAIYVILSNRIKEIAEGLVLEQTKGQYVLKIKSLDLSIWKGKIALEDAALVHLDSTRSYGFTAKLPAIYFQLRSWRGLLNNKISVDSIILTQPSFEFFEETSNPSQQKKVVFQTATIFDAMNKVVQLLHVYSFHIVDGTFIFHPVNGPVLNSNRINISIRNFGKNTNASSQLIYADDVEMSIRNQEWDLKDGRKIKFAGLHFSGRNESIEVDSVQFLSPSANSRSTLILNVDRLFLKSGHLADLYESNELKIDTIQCIRPVIQLGFDKKTSSSDTSSAISEALKSLFTNIYVKFLDIHEAQFAIEEKQNGKSAYYTTEKTDLHIDDLEIRPNETPFLTTGDINLKLNKISFYTPDSLYQLTVDEFDLYNDDLRFRNAVFSPTSNQRKKESFYITIPVLALKKLDLKKLLEKELVAEVAEMNDPVVTIQSSGEEKKNKVTAVNWTAFYGNLSGLEELIEVKMLKVHHGIIKYRSLRDSSMTATLTDFNISVLLGAFLRSKSFQDIKHSIPLLVIENVNILSPDLSVEVSKLSLLDSIHRNTVRKVELMLANGTVLKAKELLWRKLDWDELKDNGAVVADSIYVKDLSVKNDERLVRNKSAKDLPPVKIRKLNVDEFKVHFESIGDADAEVRTQGKNFLFTDLSSEKDKLYWSNVTGTLTQLEYKSSGITASVDKIRIETPGKTKLSDIKVDLSNNTTDIHARIPEIKAGLTITSTDFSRMEFSALTINEPIIKIVKIGEKHSSKSSFQVPLDLVVGRMQIKDAQFQYATGSGDSLLQISSTVATTIDSLIMHKDGDEILNTAHLSLAISNSTIRRMGLNVTVPALGFTLYNAIAFRKGDNTAFKSVVSGEWTNLSFSKMLKNNAQININGLSGMLVTSDFSTMPYKKLQWEDWAGKIQLSRGRFQFIDSTKNISAGNIKWNPSSQELQIDSVQFKPALNPPDYFAKTTWQSDYIQMHGGPINISGIDLNTWKNDSLLQANRVVLSNFNVDVWRDKRIPFKHGADKRMPTSLINSVPYRFSIDSVGVRNGNVTYHEYSKITNREGVVPIENISATIQHLTNYHLANNDTLMVRGKAKLLNTSIKKFRYAEAYNDSLGSFRLSAKISPVLLNEFSRISNPLAAVNIYDGKLDTMAARISGNKYGAIGMMTFYYHDLKIAVLDKEDTARKRLSLAFVNFVANRFVIKTNNNRQSRIFYIRDRERFVFNYWIRSVMSGMLTSAGVKRNKAYEKQYHKLKSEYSLPEVDF